MTTQTTSFIASLHKAARALDCGQYQLTGEHLARAVAIAPTPELARIVGNALLQSQFGQSEHCEHSIAMALGTVEIKPVSDLGEGWVEDEIPQAVIEAARTVEQYFKSQNIHKWRLCGICSRNHATDNAKLQADRDRLLAIVRWLKTHLIIENNPKFVEILIEARAAIAACEGGCSQDPKTKAEQEAILAALREAYST